MESYLPCGVFRLRTFTILFLDIKRRLNNITLEFNIQMYSHNLTDHAHIHFPLTLSESCNNQSMKIYALGFAISYNIDGTNTFLDRDVYDASNLIF